MAAILADTGGVAEALLETTGVAAVVVSLKRLKLMPRQGQAQLHC
jgi:hypothetical protein